VENFLWAVSLWLLVFILIPIERIKMLWPVAVISFIWMFFLNYTFVHLGYYDFTKNVFPVAGVPLLIPLGGAAGGILLMNWMHPKPMYKVLTVLLFAGFMNLASVIFMWRHAFVMLNGFNHFLHFAVNIAGVSVLVWLLLAVVGEGKIYSGDKTRFIK
jgi:hypothetical protein